MSSPLLYRGATLADKEQLIALAHASYGMYAGEMSQEHLQQMKRNMSNDDNWTNIITASKSFVCTDGGSIVGMAFLLPSGNPWDIFKAEWCYIRMVGVDPSYQGRGIARELMQRCVHHARATNEQTIALHTSETMHAARHIYEQMGFTVLQEIAPRLGWRYWLYTLELK